jgi:ATP-dependent DNA helicase MPH1
MSSPLSIQVHRTDRLRQLDLDAELSGSDSGDEPFSPSHDIETESDRQFASEFQPTQAPKGYNQHAIYLAGLSTQAARRHGLEFQGDKWDRERRDRWLGNARRPVWISQEAEEGEGEEDGYEYELGSFVCPDEDVSFDSEWSPSEIRRC